MRLHLMSKDAVVWSLKHRTFERMAAGNRRPFYNLAMVQYCFSEMLANVSFCDPSQFEGLANTDISQLLQYLKTHLT